MNSRGFALFWIIPIALILVIFSALVIERIVFNDRHLNPPELSKTSDGKDCLPNPNLEFQKPFTDLSKVLFIFPLGDTHASSPAKSYVVLKEGEEAPIYSPEDATLEKITFNSTSGYELFLRISCEITYSFDQITSLAGNLKPFSDKKDSTPNITVKKGELLGYTKGAPTTRAFGLMLLDATKPLSRINKNRWQKKESLFAQCPHDYLSTRNENNLRRFFTGKLLMQNDNIIPKVFDPSKGLSNAFCGEASHDIQNTASGGWFKGESTDTKGDYLSVNKYLSTTQISLFKDGQLIEKLTDYTRDTLPSEIKAGESTCFFDPHQNKWAYIKLVSDSSLALAKGQGPCPQSFPEVSDIWER